MERAREVVVTAKSQLETALGQHVRPCLSCPLPDRPQLGAHPTPQFDDNARCGGFERFGRPNDVNASAGSSSTGQSQQYTPQPSRAVASEPPRSQPKASTVGATRGGAGFSGFDDNWDSWGDSSPSAGKAAPAARATPAAAAKAPAAKAGKADDWEDW